MLGKMGSLRSILTKALLFIIAGPAALVIGGGGVIGAIVAIIVANILRPMVAPMIAKVTTAGGSMLSGFGTAAA